MHEYDLIADWYSRDRSEAIGVREALAALASLPRGARVLDLGCGNGIPITAALVKAGYSVVALDSSRGMLERFRRNVPDAPAVRAEARNIPFKPATFDAVVSWGMLFHLPRTNQAIALSSVSRILKPGGLFHFTAAEIATLPKDDQGITGTMNGVTFHYYAARSYNEMLADAGFELLNVYDDPGVSTYFTARKSSEP